MSSLDLLFGISEKIKTCFSKQDSVNLAIFEELIDPAFLELESIVKQSLDMYAPVIDLFQRLTNESLQTARDESQEDQPSPQNADGLTQAES